MDSSNPNEGLTMLDSKGSRVFVIPAEVKGFFRKYRNWSQIVLILIFLIIPWTKINGAQTILIDFPHRRFAFFGASFFAHDAPNLFFLFVMGAIGLAYVTAVWGRVWCGWACPQTVFIDGIYRRIEIWIEGNYIERRKLRDSKMNFDKALKYSMKWFWFFVVSSFIAHSFAAYFIGAEDLVKMVQGGPEDNWSYFLTISVITAILLFDFGWFREQFCIIACPYGRFQSVLMDKNSLAVVYHEDRGEPRKGSVAVGQKTGDCVACNRCVQVCPTNIDIRKGLQMECIACTACVDACDEIMEKVKKPKGLISYATLDGTKANPFKPRGLVYLAVIVAAFIALVVRIEGRTTFHSLILRAKETPFILENDPQLGQIAINHLRVHLTNQTWEKGLYRIVPNPEWLNQGIVFIMPMNPISVEPGKNIEGHFFVKAPVSLTKGTGLFKSKIEIVDESPGAQNARVTKEVTILGPAQ